MRPPAAFVLGIVVAGGAAAAGWAALVRPQLADLERRAADARDEAAAARREAQDAKHWAEVERERPRVLEARVKELERALESAAAAAAGRASSGAPGAGGHGGRGGAGMTPEPEPETWDRQRLNAEIERLSETPELIHKAERFPLVLRGVRAHGEDGRQLVVQMLKAGFEPPLTATAASLATSLREPRAVEPILARWKTEQDPGCRRALLRALAGIPGDAQVPILLGVWNDPAAGLDLHRFAMHGLALRKHPVALRVASGEEESKPVLRVRALESLRTAAEEEGWKDASLVPVFGRALRTAHGPAQRKLSLVALEGLWSKDALGDLDAFAADPASPPELAERARRLAQALCDGAPRPQDAGAAEGGLAPDVDDDK